MYTIHEDAEKMLKEHSFKLFRHNGLLCCVVRMGFSGVLNGYVAVDKTHQLYGKNYSDKIIMDESPEFNGNYIGLVCCALDPNRKEKEYPLDCALLVHGGLTYSSDHLSFIDKEVFDNLWWFGFDCSHCDDLKPIQSDIDREYPIGSQVYRDFKYVENETRKLAKQLTNIGG